MGDARTEAVEAMAHAACTPGEPGSCDLCKENAALQLDAIPTAALAALLRERGGLEQVGWGGCTEHIDCTDDGHEWSLVHEDGTGHLDPEHPQWPVYRLSEEPT